MKGSARSISGVHIRDVLDAVATRHPGLIEKFGGHAMAAGLTLPAATLDIFRAEFDAEVRRWMSIDDTIGIVHSDGSLQQDELTLDVARLLQQAGTVGQNFPEPMFDGCFEVRHVRILGERHLKLEVRSVRATGRWAAPAARPLHSGTSITTTRRTYNPIPGSSWPIGWT